MCNLNIVTSIYVYLCVFIGMLVGYPFDNVPTNATRAKSGVRLLATSCIIVLEYWQFQRCNGNNNWFEVSSPHNCTSLLLCVLDLLSQCLFCHSAIECKLFRFFALSRTTSQNNVNNNSHGYSYGISISILIIK